LRAAKFFTKRTQRITHEERKEKVVIKNNHR